MTPGGWAIIACAALAGHILFLAWWAGRAPRHIKARSCRLHADCADFDRWAAAGGPRPVVAHRPVVELDLPDIKPDFGYRVTHCRTCGHEITRTAETPPKITTAKLDVASAIAVAVGLVLAAALVLAGALR